ncbi:helix-turn-helix domain-containing protein [Clostridium sp. D53t1_180928_C8]|uniref:helix-turn-helix domain-containing protein n=1 Tax=Clostridium sp. D53t1_180928_C8 TaxID=2787101 RepID=UPI0018AB4897|nr:helix-turn-helix domain-containing protein [Clostridium sp. D53t1_180928_C8]
MDNIKLKEDINHGTVRFPLACYKWKRNGTFLVNFHWHDEMELVYFKKGKFTVHINMMKYEIEAPAFMFITSGDTHYIIGEEVCEESALVFDLKMLSFEYFDGIQYEIIRPLIEQKIYFPPLINNDDSIWNELVNIYNKIIKEADKEGLTRFIRVKSYLYELIALLYENNKFNYLEKKDKANDYKIDNVKKVLRYIHDNYKQKIYLDDMSKLLGMNTQYFCRYFKKLVGKTPTEYINDVRIEKAKELLAESDDKIIDIAIACGYDNIGYFIKRFEEQKHMSPSQYRKQIKSQNSVMFCQN